MTEEMPKSAAEEFAELRKEVALQRRAIERLLDERSPTPDYTETLGKMMRDLKDASKSLTWLVNRPSMQATPEALANQIVMAGDQARKQDREIMQEGARTLSRAIKDIDGHFAKARDAKLQSRRILQTGFWAVGMGAVASIMIGIGMLHLAPEHSAAWLLGLNRWEAGNRLMANANPEEWKGILQGAALYRDNRQIIDVCRADAERTGIDQKCRVILKGLNKPSF